MKFKHLLLICILLPLTGYAQNEGHSTGNGGDSVVFEFVELGRKLNQSIQKMPSKILSTDQKNAFAAAVTQTKVVAVDHLYLNGNEVDAINYPDRKLIEVSLTRWYGPFSNITRDRSKVVLHEFIWMSGINDGQYQISIPLFAEIQAFRERERKSPIAQALRQALCYSIAASDTQGVSEAIQKGADVDGTCTDNVVINYPGGTCSVYTKDVSPLHLAIEALVGVCQQKGDPELNEVGLEILNLVLAAKPDLYQLQSKNYRSEAPLEHAYHIRAYRAAEALLKAGTNPNTSQGAALPGMFGYLAWNFASAPISGLQALLDVGADINLIRSSTTFAAYILSHKGREDLMKVLVNSGKVNWCQKVISDGLSVSTFSVVAPEYLPYVLSKGAGCAQP